MEHKLIAKPLKLIAPKASRTCQSVYMLSYGGGLVGGDSINLKVVLDHGTCLSLGTQGSTKIFKVRPQLPPTRQTMEVTIKPSATCILIPDPVQPFADSAYIQDQVFKLHERSNLILLDWVVSGRPANGECWDFHSFTSTNSIQQIASTGRSRLLIRDCQIMKRPETKIQMTTRNNCIATLVFTGPLLENAAKSILQKFKDEGRITGHATSKVNNNARDRPFIWTVAKHRGVVVLKVVGVSSETVKDALRAFIDEFDWRDQFGADAFRALD